MADIVIKSLSNAVDNIGIQQKFSFGNLQVYPNFRRQHEILTENILNVESSSEILNL